MSGIIGGAGSKSGVIGTTELDYEEGTWTPVPSAGSFSSVGYNWYRKIGGMCWVTASITNVAGGGFSTISGLPFATNPTGSSYEGASGAVLFNGVNLPSNTVNVSPYIYNNALYFYATIDDAGWAHLTSSNFDNNDDMLISAYYFCVK